MGGHDSDSTTVGPGAVPPVVVFFALHFCFFSEYLFAFWLVLCIPTRTYFIFFCLCASVFIFTSYLFTFSFLQFTSFLSLFIFSQCIGVAGVCMLWLSLPSTTAWRCVFFLRMTIIPKLVPWLLFDYIRVAA